jgi:hemoglobin-like flavoprotein
MGTVCSSPKEITLDVQVAHFTPACFPLAPTFNQQTSKICKKSWGTLMKMTYKSTQTGLDTSSITVFYNEFYRKLYLYDTKHQFDSVLSKHLTGKGSNIAAKGAIIVRIVKFSLTIENNKSSIDRLKRLGRSHALMGIEAWQYSVFVEVLLNTIASQLGTHATHDVMSCWVNLFSFIFQHMIPSALRGHVTGSDLNVAIHTDHVERDVQSRLQVEEDGVVCTSHSKNSRLNSLKEEVALEAEEEAEEKADQKKKSILSVNVKSIKNEDKYSSSIEDPLRPSRSFTLVSSILTKTDTTVSTSQVNPGILSGGKYVPQNASSSKSSPLVLTNC